MGAQTDMTKQTNRFSKFFQTCLNTVTVRLKQLSFVQLNGDTHTRPNQTIIPADFDGALNRVMI